MKRDEIRFLSMIATMTNLSPSDIMAFPDFPFTQEQAQNYLQKWYSKGWYVYSKTLSDGNLTPEGLKHARSVGILTKKED